MVLDYGASQYPNWAAMSGEQFETHVKQLLKLAYPHGHGVNGKGGDRGRDFVVPLPGGSHVFQMKAVPDRITPSWKRKISDSFEKIVEQDNVVAWTLVVPIELTINEQDWFTATFTNNKFDTSYEDEIWLRNMIAKYPAIRFSMFEVGTARAIVQDNLTAVGNPIASALDLVNAANKLSAVGRMLSTTHVLTPLLEPDGHAGFCITRQDGQPDRIDLSVLAAHVAPDVLDDLSWGRPSAFECSLSGIDAALGSGGLLLKLSGEDAPANIRAEGTAGPPIGLVLEALNEHGSIRHSIVLAESSATIGPAGAELLTSDRSGWMNLVLKVGAGGETELSLSYHPESDAYPDDIIDALRFVQGCSGSDLRFKLRLAGDEIFVSEAVPVKDGLWEAPEAFTTYVDDVIWLQRYAGVRHRITFDRAAAEHRDVHRLAQLLKDETVDPLNGSITVEGVGVPKELVAPQGVMVAFDEDFTELVVQGVEYPVGPHRRRWVCRRAIVQNQDEVRAAYEADIGCTVILASAPESGWSSTIVRLDEAA